MSTPYAFGGTQIVHIEDLITPPELVVYYEAQARHYESRGDLLCGIVGTDGAFSYVKSCDLAKVCRAAAEKWRGVPVLVRAANDTPPAPSIADKLADLRDAIQE